MTSREIVKERKNKLIQKFKKISLAFSFFVFIGATMAIVYFVVEKIKNDNVTDSIKRINKKINDDANSNLGLFNTYKKASTNLITQIPVRGNNVPWLKLEKGSYEDLKTSPKVDAQVINKKILDNAFLNKFPVSQLNNPIGNINNWYLLENKGVSTTKLFDELSEDDVFSKELFENFLGKNIDETRLEKFTNVGTGTLNSLDAAEQSLTTRINSFQSTLNNDYSEKSQINTWLSTKAWVDYSYTKTEVNSNLPVNENNVDNTFIARATDQIDYPIFSTITVTPTKDYVDAAIGEINAVDYQGRTNPIEGYLINKLSALESSYDLVKLLTKLKKIKDRMVDKAISITHSSPTTCSGLTSYTLKDWLNKFVRSGDPQLTDEDMRVFYRYEDYFSIEWKFFTQSFAGYSPVTVSLTTYTPSPTGLTGCDDYTWYLHIKQDLYPYRGDYNMKIRIWQAYKKSTHIFGTVAYSQYKSTAIYGGYYQRFYVKVNWSNIYRDFHLSPI